ncbi:A24 family peptidase [Micrococcus luteus]|uniref:A24 family peptidase n=1 Tax=Micrococcus luteus TaxID=1270 RepID=UPI0034038A61
MATASPPESIPARAERQEHPLPSARSRRAATLAATITAAAAVPLLAAAGMDPARAHALAALLVLIPLGVYLARVDLAVHRLPNWAVAAVAAGNLGALIGLGMTGPAAAAGGMILGALLTAALAAVIFLVMHLIGGTGMGDVKLVAACALAIGAHGMGAWLLAVLASYVLAALIVAVPALLSGRRGRVALGPYLVAGHALALIWCTAS